MKLNNYNGKWDWAVFWLHGIIGFIVGFLLWFFSWVTFVFHDWQFLFITSSVVGVISFVLAGCWGDKFWNYLREHGSPW